MVLRRERDPFKMNGQAGNENRQIKINAGKRGEAERDTEEVQSFHVGSIAARCLMSRATLSSGKLTKSEAPMNEAPNPGGSFVRALHCT